MIFSLSLSLSLSLSKMTYFRQHGCTTKEAHAKYNSRAAQLYREKLHGLAIAAHKKYGTNVCNSWVVHAFHVHLHICIHTYTHIQLHIDTQTTVESKEDNFFSTAMAQAQMDGKTTNQPFFHHFTS